MGDLVAAIAAALQIEIRGVNGRPKGGIIPWTQIRRDETTSITGFFQQRAARPELDVT
jgi:hypothetical protein